MISATAAYTARHRLTVVALASLLAAVPAVAQDHSGHNAQSGHGDHQMSEGDLAVLRERIPLYREYKGNIVELFEINVQRLPED